jgi:glucose/arabinose dehydrogenase
MSYYPKRFILIFPAIISLTFFFSTLNASAEKFPVTAENSVNILQFEGKNPLACFFDGSISRLGVMSSDNFHPWNGSKISKFLGDLKNLTANQLKEKRRRNLAYRGINKKQFLNFRKECETFNPGSTQATPTAVPTLPVNSNIPKIALNTFAQGFNQPLYLTHSNDNTGRLFVVERQGKIRIVKNGVIESQPFLDITSKVGSSGTEQGLLSVAFHPSYAQNGRFFVDYTNLSGDSVISEFKVSGNPDIADSTSEKQILFADQPAENHNGGLLKFGPDGYLYIGFGDGGGGGDTYRNGQNLNSLLGGLLRIDINQGNPYSIPSDNPFLGVAGAKAEKWAYGLRNPWRFSFDRADGRLFLADVGQGAVEEVDIVTKGGNYGWPIMEGSTCYGATSCNRNGLILPISEYNHSEGESITGGYVYRGTSFPDLYGKYIFADFGSARIWVLIPDGSQFRRVQIRDQSDLLVSSFGEDQDGNLYLISYNGVVYKIEPAT